MKRARTDTTSTALPEWARDLKPEQLGRILPTKEAGEFLNLSRVSLYRHTKLGNLPEPIRFGLRSKGWRLVDLIQAQARMLEQAGGK